MEIYFIIVRNVENNKYIMLKQQCWDTISNTVIVNIIITDIQKIMEFNLKNNDDFCKI